MTKGANSPLSAQDSAKIKALYQSGVSVYQIAKQTGFACSTIHRHATGQYKRKPKAVPPLPKLTATLIGDCPVSGQRLFMVTGAEHEHLVSGLIVDLSGWARDE